MFWWRATAEYKQQIHRIEETARIAPSVQENLSDQDARIQNQAEQEPIRSHSHT